MNALDERLKRLVADVFRYPQEELVDRMGPGDIPGWDSLGHVALMAEVQHEFGTHVPVEDAIEIESIADLRAILERSNGHAPGPEES